METEVFRYIGLGFACVALVSTVVYYVFKYQELKTLREIRDRLPQK